VSKVVAITVVAGNSVAAAVGVKTGDITSDQVYGITTSVLTIAGFGLAAWKNFNFTSAAQTAQNVLEALKDGKITAEEVESLLSGVEQIVATAAPSTDTSTTDAIGTITPDIPAADGDGKGSE